MVVNVPDKIDASDVARGVTPSADSPLVDQSSDRRGPKSLGHDALSQAELERELEELWLKHVEPHFPKTSTSC